MILIILGFVIMAPITVVPLVKRKYWRELVVFSFLYVISFTICILQQVGVKLPHPFDALKSFLNLINFHL